MKLKNVDVVVDKVGGLEIFSWNGYLLGGNGFSQHMSFFPIVIDANNYNKRDLDAYFEFVNSACKCDDIDLGRNYHEGEYPYNVFLKECYNDLGEYKQRDMKKLIKTLNDPYVYITPRHSISLNLLVYSLMGAFYSMNKNFKFNDFSDHSGLHIIFFLNDDNYIKIKINCCQQYLVDSHSTLKKMDKVIETFERLLSMFNKNFNGESSWTDVYFV